MANPHDELFEHDRLVAKAGAAKMTGALSLVLIEDEVELFRTDADSHISIDPIFVGFFSTFRTASLALHVYLSLSFLAIIYLSQRNLEFVLNLSEYSLET